MAQAQVYIHNGTDYASMAFQLMEAANIQSQLRPDMHVVLKPNLAVARPAQEGATTHPQLVEGVIAYLHTCGIRHITIAEGSWVGDSTQRAWDICGYRPLEKRYGVTLLDTKEDATVQKQAGGLSLSVCQAPLGADYLINLPVLKGHCQTDLTCCLKNLKGCIPDAEKRRFHTLGLHRPIAALAKALQPHLHIVDNICGDLNFEEGGNPVATNRILLGFDAVLLDSLAAQLIGYQPEDIQHLRLAKEWGVGEYLTPSTPIIELRPDQRPLQSTSSSRTARRYAPYIAEDSACSACYAALIYALHQTGITPRQKICIGQGYRGKTIDGTGVGACTQGCSQSVPGCPPRASHIAAFLRQL